jgi:hypothetical protein
MKPCTEAEKRTETTGAAGSATRVSTADSSFGAGLSASQVVRIRVGGWIANFFSWYRY